MKTNKNEITKKYSWNFLLLLYFNGVIAMIFVLFAPIFGDISLWTIFTASFDDPAELVMYFNDGIFKYYMILFLFCVLYKAISLSIWLGKNI